MATEHTIRKLLAEDSVLKNLMDKSRGKDLDYAPIFVGTPTDAFIKTENAPWIRISDIGFDSAIYADDKRLFNYSKLQIDFWIKQTDVDGLTAIERHLYKFMSDNGFERYYKYHVNDPDTMGLIMVQGNYEGLERMDIDD